MLYLLWRITMKIRSEELEARKLELEGYIVIRAFTRGCPDIIAFKPEDASKVMAREVKGPKDASSPDQRRVIDYLKSKGVNAHFYYSQAAQNISAAECVQSSTPLKVADHTP